MTHNAHRLAAHRLRGEPERTLTGGLACYRIYETADGRFLTVTAVELKFWQRLCELIGRPELVERHYEQDQDALCHASSRQCSGRGRCRSGSTSSTPRT